MAEFDELDTLEEEEEQTSKINKKKIIIFLLPILIAIGIAVGMYHTFGSSGSDKESGAYKILPQAEGTEQQPLIFYDLPEINAPLKKTSSASEIVRLNLTIELTNKEDIAKIEVLLPRLYDITLAHVNGLMSSEISGTEGMYWLKQELLYRLRLAANPINIADINIKNIEIEKNI